MTDRQAAAEDGRSKRARLPFRILATAVIVLISVYLLLKVALLTPYPSAALGELLSGYTGLKVTVGGISLVGGTLSIEGIAVGNPSGFRKRTLLTVGTLRATPDPAGIIRAERRLSRLEIRGVALDLEKGPGGEWNFAPFMRRLREPRKGPPREIFIGSLSLSDVSLRVNGRGVDNLGITVNDLSTRGTTESYLAVSLRDAMGNPVSLTAEGRLGASPALRARLQAPRLSLSPLVGMLPARFPVNLEQAGAGVELAADYRDSRLTAQGTVGLAGLGLRVGGESRQLGGEIEFSGSYDTGRDSAVLQRALLTAGGIASMKVAGSMERVRTDGDFVLSLSHEPIGLGGLFGLLPAKSRRGYSLEGTMLSRGLRLEGSRTKGITACEGNIYLRSVELVGGGRTLLSRGGADLGLKPMGSGWLATGRVFSAEKGDGALIGSLEAPFTARLSPRFRPEMVDFPAIAASVGGGRIGGTFRYMPAYRQVFRGNLAVRGVPLASLNRQLAGAKVRFSSGSGVAAVRFSGTSPRDLTGQVNLALSSASGTFGERRFSLGKGVIVSGVRRSPGGFTASGRLETAVGHIDGRPFRAASDLALAGNLLRLAKTELDYDGGLLRIGSAAVRLPTGGGTKAASGLPIAASVSGAVYRRGELVAEGLSGELGCRYFGSGTERRLEGGGAVTVGSLSFRGRKAASFNGKLAFGGREISARFAGESLGGALDATLTVAPFSAGTPATFSARLRGQQLERLSHLLPENKGPRLSGGMADIALVGTWDRPSGARGRISLTGRDISLKGAGNRTLVSGFGLVMDSSVSGQDLLLKEAVLKREGGPVLRVAGSVRGVAGAERAGSLTISMAATPLNSMLDAFANSLPKALQEASGGGSCELEGGLKIQGKGVTLDGGLSLRNASLEIPSQKVLVADIDGRIPFSLTLPARAHERKPADVSFSRENYPQLLKSFGGSSGAGSRLRIGRTHFGALEIGEITLVMTARRGEIEISPLRVSLYDGYLTGSGFIQYGNGFNYGADLLLHDLSLRQFCDSFPKIKGYMTGRVDGVVSLLNVKGGVDAAAGFVNLWTRSGKGEEMLVSKEFLQKLAGKKLRGFLFRNDRAYDNAEIVAYLRGGFLTFERLDISHTNFLGMKDLSVTVAPVQNRIALDHLLESIREAAARGKVKGEQEAPPIQTDLKWLE